MSPGRNILSAKQWHRTGKKMIYAPFPFYHFILCSTPLSRQSWDEGLRQSKNMVYCQIVFNRIFGFSIVHYSLGRTLFPGNWTLSVISMLYRESRLLLVTSFNSTDSGQKLHGNVTSAIQPPAPPSWIGQNFPLPSLKEWRRGIDWNPKKRNQDIAKTPPNPLKAMPVDKIINPKNKEGGRAENPV